MQFKTRWHRQKCKMQKGQFVAPSVASTVAASNVNLPKDSKAFIIRSPNKQCIPDCWIYMGFNL